MSNIPDFIGKQEVELPVGGSFVRTGHIAPWMATHLWRFKTDVDEATAVEEGLGPDTTSGKDNDMWYYESKTVAEKVIKHYDIRNQHEPDKAQYTQYCWMLQAQVKPENTVLTLSGKALENWDGEVIDHRVDIQALQPITHKSRGWNGYAFQLISLPLAVAAYATLLGYDNPGFDVSELMEPDQAFTDELFAHLTGNPENKSYARLDDSVLWQRRIELWNALGETDPKRFKPWKEGAKVGAFDTKAEKLCNALQIVTGGTWSNTVYARVVKVPDPKPGSGTWGVVGLMEIFKGKEEAQAAVDAEKAARSNGNGQNGLTYPGIYNADDENRKAFDEVLSDVKASGKALPMMKKALVENLGLENDAEIAQAFEWLK